MVGLSILSSYHLSHSTNSMSKLNSFWTWDCSAQEKPPPLDASDSAELSDSSLVQACRNNYHYRCYWSMITWIYRVSQKNALSEHDAAFLHQAVQAWPDMRLLAALMLGLLDGGRLYHALKVRFFLGHPVDMFWPHRFLAMWIRRPLLLVFSGAMTI